MSVSGATDNFRHFRELDNLQRGTGDRSVYTLQQAYYKKYDSPVQIYPLEADDVYGQNNCDGPYFVGWTG